MSSLISQFKLSLQNFGKGNLKNDAKVIIPVAALIGISIETFMELTGFYAIRRRKSFERSLDNEVQVMEAKFHLVPEIVNDIMLRQIREEEEAQKGQANEVL